MKITILTPVYPRDSRPDSGKFIENLAIGWSRLGIDVHVISIATISDRLKEKNLGLVNYCRESVSVHLVPILGQPFSRVLPNWLRRFLQSIDRKLIDIAVSRSVVSDVVYCQFASSGYWAYRLHRNTGQKYVLDLGESNSLLGGQLDQTLRKVGSDEVSRNVKTVSSAAAVVSVSPRLRREAIQLGAEPSKVRVIPNVPNRDIFFPRDKSQCRKKLGIPPNCFVVLYLGHLSDRKGAGRLDLALRKTRGSPAAVFLGNGDFKLAYDNILKRGVVRHDELALWLCASDVMALPTLGEGCCNAIAEAIQSALPIVTSDIDDVRWQVPVGGGMLLNPHDTDGLASVLDELMKNPECIVKMREALIAQNSAEISKARDQTIIEFLESQELVNTKTMS